LKLRDWTVALGKNCELNTIREELENLRFLYKKIAEQHIPVEEPSPEDIEAIESDDDVVGLDEVLALLDRVKGAY
jgi:hypothetical protein